MAYTYSTGTDYTWSTWTWSFITTTTSSDSTWYTWSGNSASTTSSTATTWSTWNYDRCEWQKLADNGTYQAKPIVYTKEQLAEQKAQLEKLAAQRAEQARLAKEREKKDAEAREKSKQLLISLLDKKQVEDLEKNGSFGFVAPSGKLYKIEKGVAGNVFLMDTCNRKVERYCCHPKMEVPSYDAMASQFIWLKFCEEEFVKLANKTRM